MKPAAAALAVLSVLALAAPAAAHSLKELEAALAEREAYFQAVDTPAPGFTLADAEGRTVRLADLKGRVVVLNFIYAGCPDVCPLHAEKIADVQAKARDAAMADRVRFVTVTTDPANDTAEVMRAYGPAHGLDPANWTFLTARPGDAEDATRRLARAYGHKFEKTADGYQMHGVVTHVIDADGRWRANFHGLRFGATNLVLFLNALANDVHTPHGHAEPSLWDKLKELF